MFIFITSSLQNIMKLPTYVDRDYHGISEVSTNLKIAEQ